MRRVALALVAVAALVAFAVARLGGVDQRGAHVETLAIDSALVGEELPTTVVVPVERPPGRRPLLVGAYDIARLDPARFCAVGGHSPAV